MKLSMGCDHAALELKNALIEYLKGEGYEVIDRGTYTKESCDYTDFGIMVGEDIRDKRADRGIVICSTGIGISIACNKVKGVRCALVHYVEEARITREHNDSNCLALSAKYTSIDLAKEIVDAWLTTAFSEGERHIRRINKINKYEEE